MTFLPIVARELRVASRRPVTYWVRSGAALAVLGLAGWFFLLLTMRGASNREIAQGLFWIMAGGAVLYCLLSGVWFTADCLSREKREGTLGLLFLTDLRGYDVVLGKLAASSVNGLYAALAFVPMLALPILMGGLALGEFVRMALVLINTLLFSLALGMAVSALSRSARVAMGVTFLLLLFLTALLPALGLWQAATTGLREVGRGWLVTSVGFGVSRAPDLVYNARPHEFWWSVAVLHGLGWLGLLLASAVAPRNWQDRPAGTRALRWRERWRTWCYGNAAERAGFRQQLLDHRACCWPVAPRRLERSAYFWLAARARLRPALVWAVLGLIACGWFWGLARVGRDWLNEGTYFLTGFLLSAVIKILFGLDAGRQLAEDRNAGTLELLLTTPLTLDDILRGQWLALRRQFQGPAIVVLLVFCLFFVAGGTDRASQLDELERNLWFVLWTALAVILVADLSGLYWYGMWRGLTARNPARAAVGNLAAILLLPWIALALAFFTCAFLWRNARDEPLQIVLYGGYFGLSLATDLGFALWARRKLLTEFRLVAAQQYVPRAGFWKRWISGAPQSTETPHP